MLRAAVAEGDGVLDPRRCARGGPPPEGGCWHEHNPLVYLQTKPKDAPFPPPPPKLVDSDSKEGRPLDLHLLRPIGQSTTTTGLSHEAQAYLDEHYQTSEPFVRWAGEDQPKKALAPQPEATTIENKPPEANATTEEQKPSEIQKESMTEPATEEQTFEPDPTQSLRSGVYCPAFGEYGSCQAGWRCRTMGAHAHLVPDEQDTQNPRKAGTTRAGSIELEGVPVPKTEADEVSHELGTSRYAVGEYNWVPGEVMKALRKREYPLPYTSVALRKLNDSQAGDNTKIAVSSQEAHDEFPELLNRVKEHRAKVAAQQKQSKQGKRKRGPPAPALVPAPETNGEVDYDALDNQAATLQAPAVSVADEPEPQLLYDISSIDLAKPRAAEKKRLNWHGDLYLAPLTTVGNLPFRRLCTTFGVDITCGEMGLAESYCSGNPSEWSLVRRWEGERTFGAQLCGSRPEQLVPVAEALYNECGPQQLDFVDLNCGCPIDLVCNRGGGSALMDHVGRLGTIVKGMNAVLGEIPVTVKVRTGTTGSRTQTAHKLLPRLPSDFGAGAVTLHGRSKQQRYKSMADWTYIAQCSRGVREAIQRANEESSEADQPEVATVPIYGNGDVYSYEDYDAHMSLGELDGCMIGRGGLIKPWLFTEIKEHRDWDISSRERLDMVRQFCQYGLAHWGADAHGVQLTRRFLCEALSFWHRYVPLGLLEYLPPRLNDRPPSFQGRDDLETLLASPNAADWVKISDMFLGPAPEEWNFVPKHKSNSFETEAQG